MHALAVDLYCLLVEIDDQVAGDDHRLGVALRAADDGVDSRHQLVFVERLGEIIIGAVAEAAHFVFNPGHAGENENRRLDFGQSQSPEDFVARHVRQIQVEENNVVVVELAEIDPFLAEISDIDVEILRLEHQFDALRRCSVVLD